MSALLSLQGVSKRFRGLVAVDGVTFDVAAGELFAIIGPNGAGKTTLFNMIAGTIAPDSGSIKFTGEGIGGMPPDAICRRGIGRTFQIVRPFPALTVEDNVVVGALLHNRNVAILRTLNRDGGLTIVLIEHVMRAVMALASNVLVLDHGIAIAQGRPEAIVRDPAVVQSYLGAEPV